MDSQTYHLHELEIARTNGDPRRVMPPIPPGNQRLLDVGCGAGQTLIASDLNSEVLAIGIDVDLQVLRLGRKLTSRIQFVCSRGEDLPFKDESFDMVVCRVALPLMHIPDALREIQRVLKTEGRLWSVVHPFSMACRQLCDALVSFNFKNIVYRLYVLTNGLLFMLRGTVYRYPLKRERCESFQTQRGMERALTLAGFDDITFHVERHFVVTAAKV